MTEQDVNLRVDFDEIDSTLVRGYAALRKRIEDIDRNIESLAAQRQALRLQLGRLEMALGMRDDLVWAHVNGDDIKLDGRDAWMGASSALPLDLLSPREREVFDVLGSGATTREVGTSMGVVHTTVETYIRRIREKLDIDSFSELRYEAIVFALNGG